jgi:hypothetical protein
VRLATESDTNEALTIDPPVDSASVALLYVTGHNVGDAYTDVPKNAENAEASRDASTLVIGETPCPGPIWTTGRSPG